MKIHELAKKTGISNKELLEETGLKSHMSNVPEEVVTQYIGQEKKIEAKQEAEEVVDTPKAVVIETRSKEAPCPYTAEQIELGCRCLGNKSKMWKWRKMSA